MGAGSSVLFSGVDRQNRKELSGGGGSRESRSTLSKEIGEFRPGKNRVGGARVSCRMSFPWKGERQKTSQKSYKGKTEKKAGTRITKSERGQELPHLFECPQPQSREIRLEEEGNWGQCQQSNGGLIDQSVNKKAQ